VTAYQTAREEEELHSQKSRESMGVGGGGLVGGGLHLQGVGEEEKSGEGKKRKYCVKRKIKHKGEERRVEGRKVATPPEDPGP